VTDSFLLAAASKLVVPRDQSPRVAVAIPTVRQPERLAQCLRGVLAVAETDGVPVEIVVVLDGADADVCAFVHASVEGATVVSWPERRGFAAGINAAFRATSTPHLVLVQDDVMPQQGWLASLLQTADRHPRAGVIGSLVMSTDLRVMYAGAVIGGNGLTSAPWVGEAPPRSSFTSARAVDYVSSASFLVDREAWAAVGGFDEQFYPAIYVDADFCTALWHAGWRVLVDPHSSVVHARHGSMSQPFRDFVYPRNNQRFMRKWGAFVAGRPPCPGTPTEIEAAVTRAATWLENPPPVSRRFAGPPTEDAPSVYVQRERDLLRDYVAALEACLDAMGTRGSAQP
jgi:GT2 family glycosyltransferase